MGTRGGVFSWALSGLGARWLFDLWAVVVTHGCGALFVGSELLSMGAGSLSVGTGLLIVGGGACFCGWQVFLVGDFFDLELKGSVTAHFQGVHKKKTLTWGCFIRLQFTSSAMKQIFILNYSLISFT